MRLQHLKSYQPQTPTIFRAGLLLFSLLVLLNSVRLPLGEASDEPHYLDFTLFINQAGHPLPDNMITLFLSSEQGF